MPINKRKQDTAFFLCDSIDDLTKEEKLILTCSRTWATSGEIESSIYPDLDWDYTLETATNHHVVPLLYYSFQKVSSDLIPSDVIKKLQQKYTITLAKNILAVKELKSVLKSFLESGIEVILLKGVALADTVYPDIALRPFNDVDILVRKEDINKARLKLSQLGYKLELSEYRPGFAERFWYVADYTGENLYIDLHWHIIRHSYSKYAPITHFWDSAVPIYLDDLKIKVLSPENLLISLCFHALKHHYSSLLYFVDIAEVINYYNKLIDWNVFIENIRQYKIYSLVRYVLDLTKALLNPPSPTTFLEQIIPTNKKLSLEEKLLNALINSNTTKIEWDIADFIMLDSCTARIQYIYSKFFPCRDFLLFKYPNRSIYSSYFLWQTRIFRESIKFLLKGLAKYNSYY